MTVRLETLEQFAFGLPLYARANLAPDFVVKAAICGFISSKVDGHCPDCGRQSTFSRGRLTGSYFDLSEAEHLKQVEEREEWLHFVITCARDHRHKIAYWCIVERDGVIKIGQYPSLADIANDEASRYRKILNREDAAELHKAIGLAAHGVGIGSFVYLRRIFERLVNQRFRDFQSAEGWAEEDFVRMRMDEKIEFLKGHVPEFLVENRRLYAILSKGIHELSEDICLKAFDPIKLSLKIILEEDKKKREELDLRRQASEAIKAFES
jgi:hypothetical protein